MDASTADFVDFMYIMEVLHLTEHRSEAYVRDHSGVSDIAMPPAAYPEMIKEGGKGRGGGGGGGGGCYGPGYATDVPLSR